MNKNVKWIVGAVVVLALLIGGYLMSQRTTDTVAPQAGRTLPISNAANGNVKQAPEVAPIKLADSEAGLPVETIAIRTKDGRDIPFDMEIVEKPIDIQVGLMFRKQMARNAGMMFKMGKPARPTSFWMKNTLISLDMLFVDEEGKIINIHRNARPQALTQIPSKGAVIGVIELNGGMADANRISVGDHVQHPYFKK